MVKILLAAAFLSCSPTLARADSLDDLILKLESLNDPSMTQQIETLKRMQKKPVDEKIDPDAWALQSFSNMAPTFDTMAAVIDDLSGMAPDLPALKKVQDHPSFAFNEHNYVVSLGGGHGSRDLFQILARSFAGEPGGAVMYRTIGKPSRWVGKGSVDLKIEYYGVPGSHIYAYRLSDAKIPESVGNYGIIMNKNVYRTSFTTNQGKGTVEVHWFMNGGYDKDLAEVLKKASSEKIRVVRDSGVQLVITAKALY